MNRLFLITSVMLISLFLGCAKSSDKGKALLEHQLKLVGIPQEIVVNICQDDNDNGTCDVGELQAKVRVNRNDTVAEMWEKVKFDENGKYILHNYDPTKKILMEIEDNEALNNSGQKVTLSYEPKDEETVPVQELSILQSLIDNNLIKEEEVTKLKESNVRPKVDTILLENLFENQKVLVENNMSTVDARDRNLEYIAEGLRDINVSGNLVENLQSCENNNSCEETILQDANEQTQIDRKEAQVIAETNSTEGTGDKDTSLTTEENNTSASEEEPTPTPTATPEPSPAPNTEKQVADGYLIKLASPATAYCGDNEYTSSLSVGEKGKITFEHTSIPNNCHIFIPSGATIDSNNNGVLDSNDTVLNFSMKGSSEGSFISPLTTMLVIKEANGEDVTELKAMVQNFDPVECATNIINSSGAEKVKNQKLMLLMETLKIALSESEGNVNISDINISNIIHTQVDESLDDFSVDISSFNSDIQEIISDSVSKIKNLIKTFDSLDPNKIDINSLYINISDQGSDIEDAIRASLKVTIDASDNLLEIITKSDANLTALYNQFSSMGLGALSSMGRPTATAGADITVVEGQDVNLSGLSSYDINGYIVSYEWKEGNSTLATTATFNKNDFTVGTHNLTLIVTDNDNQTDSETIIVTVNSNPNALNHIGTQPAGLISPNGGETWTTDVNETISWNSNLFGDNITLYVLHDDPSDIPAVSSTLNQLLSSKNWYQFENNISNVGNITINPSILNGNGNAYIILIVDGTEDNWDISDNTFTLNSNTGNTLKKTGQTKSYDQEGNEVTDGSIKDDGYYQTGATPSYSRAKEIVTDNITGLMWQDDEEAKTVRKNWEDAKSYCADLSLGGDSDWRLPTIVELLSIVVDGKVNPSIDTTKFVNYTTSYYYWSSTTYASNAGYARGVRFSYGYTDHDYKSNSNYVRCVRAGQ